MQKLGQTVTSQSDGGLYSCARALPPGIGGHEAGDPLARANESLSLTYIGPGISPVWVVAKHLRLSRKSKKAVMESNEWHTSCQREIKKS
jgi:hypothetical protein